LNKFLISPAQIAPDSTSKSLINEDARTFFPSKVIDLHYHLYTRVRIILISIKLIENQKRYSFEM
jgi:hypothetical protein